MRLLALVMAGGICLGAAAQEATEIWFNMRECTGSPLDRLVKIEPLDGPKGFYGTNIVAPVTTYVQPRLGVGMTNLVIGNYRVSFSGITKAFNIFWPADPSITNAADPRVQRDGMVLTFSLSQTNGGGGGGSLDTNSVNALIAAATFPLSSLIDGGYISLWAGRDTAELDGVVDDIATINDRLGLVEQALPATNVQYAARAGYATNASSATNAQYAIAAGSATTATSATIANEATHAAAADHATTATTATNLYGTSVGTHIGEVRPQSGTNVFQIRRTNDNAIVFWITSDGQLHGDGSALTGVASGTATNVSLGSITNANQLTNWAGITPSSKVDTSAIGTAGYSNAASFYPASNPSNYIAITASTNGNIFEIWRTNAPAAIVFAIGSNGLLYGDASALTNITGGSGGVYVAAGNGITATTNNGVVTLSIGASSVSNIYDLNLSVITSNLTDWVNVYTNPVSASNTFSGSFWVRGRGPTNSYFGRFDPIYSRGYASLFTYASNVVSSSGSLSARPTTNASGLVWQVNGGGNQSVNWSIKGWYEHETNGVFSVAAGGGGGGLPLTNALIAYWGLEGSPWEDLGPSGSYGLTASSIDTTNAKVAVGAYFNNATDRLYTADADDFTIGNGGKSFTVAAWFKPYLTNSSIALAGKGATSTGVGQGEWTFYWSPTSRALKLYFPTNSTGKAVVSGPTNNIVLNNWHLGVAVVDITNLTAQVWQFTTAGFSGTETNISPSFPGFVSNNTTNDVHLGVNPFSTTALSGSLDEVEIWGRALTGAEVTNLWVKANSGQRVIDAD